MTKIEDIYFINHCEPPCGLGYAEFICPFCGKYTKDFGYVWYNFSGQGRVDDFNKDAEFMCEECNQKGIIQCIEYEYFLKDEKI